MSRKQNWYVERYVRAVSGFLPCSGKVKKPLLDTLRAQAEEYKVLGLMVSNGLVALSSALLAQYQGFADVNMGRGAIVIGLAAVIIGEAIFSRIFRNFALRLLSVAFGSILYYLVLQTVIWMGIDTDLLKMLSALVVAVFLAVPYWKGKYFAKPAKRGGKNNA